MRKKIVEPVIDYTDAKSLLKVVTVLLRDHTHMSYHDASLGLAYCWRHTETEQKSVEREKRYA